MSKPAAKEPKHIYRPFSVVIPVVVHADTFSDQPFYAAKPLQLQLKVWAFDREGAVERLKEKLERILDLGPI